MCSSAEAGSSHKKPTVPGAAGTALRQGVFSPETKRNGHPGGRAECLDALAKHLDVTRSREHGNELIQTPAGVQNGALTGKRAWDDRSLR